MANPYGIANRCILRNTTLPRIPCDCEVCDWKICSTDYNNCFWVLAETINASPGHPMSYEEIGDLLGISAEEAESVANAAIKKLGYATRHWNNQ